MNEKTGRFSAMTLPGYGDEWQSCGFSPTDDLDLAYSQAMQPCTMAEGVAWGVLDRTDGHIWEVNAKGWERGQKPKTD